MSQRPTIEELTKRYEDPTYEKPITRDGQPPKDDSKTETVIVLEDKFNEQTVNTKFRVGVREVCSKKLFAQLEVLTKKEEDKTKPKVKQADLFRRFGEGIRQQKISDWKKGLMSLEELVTMLSHLDWEYSDLEPLPPMRDRAIGGFEYAVHYAKTGIEKRYLKPDERITEEELFTISRVIEHELYLVANIRRKLPSDADWETIADDCRPQVAKSIGRPVNKLLYLNGADYKSCFQKWGNGVLKAILNVKHEIDEELAEIRAKLIRRVGDPA